MVFRAADVFNDYTDDKRQLELSCVGGVLRRLGFDVTELQPADRPDVVAVLSRSGQTCRIGCEVNLLHADQTPTGSPLRQFWRAWLGIAREVHKQLSRDLHIVPYCVVRFCSNSYRVDLRDRDEIIRDLYLLGRRLGHQAEIVVGAEYPAISNIVSSVTVVDFDGGGRLWWPSHLQSGAVSSLDGAVRQSIIEKCRLARGYDWPDVDRKWLLLVADGRGTTDIIGRVQPFEVPEESPCRSMRSLCGTASRRIFGCWFRVLRFSPTPRGKCATSPRFRGRFNSSRGVGITRLARDEAGLANIGLQPTAAGAILSHRG